VPPSKEEVMGRNVTALRQLLTTDKLVTDLEAEAHKAQAEVNALEGP
jgi:hypothetical protein